MSHPAPVRPSRRARRLPTAAVAVLALSAGACSDGGTAAADETPFANAVAALCEATATQDAGVADVAFWSGAHAELHDLAKQVLEVDRAAAADLLRRKNQVEQGLRDELALDELRPRLTALLDRTRDALSALGHDAPTC